MRNSLNITLIQDGGIRKPAQALGKEGVMTDTDLKVEHFHSAGCVSLISGHHSQRCRAQQVLMAEDKSFDLEPQ